MRADDETREADEKLLRSIIDEVSAGLRELSGDDHECCAATYARRMFCSNSYKFEIRLSDAPRYSSIQPRYVSEEVKS